MSLDQIVSPESSLFLLSSLKSTYLCEPLCIVIFLLFTQWMIATCHENCTTRFKSASPCLSCDQKLWILVLLSYYLVWPKLSILVLLSYYSSFLSAYENAVILRVLLKFLLCVYHLTYACIGPWKRGLNCDFYTVHFVEKFLFCFLSKKKERFLLCKNVARPHVKTQIYRT